MILIRMNVQPLRDVAGRFAQHTPEQTGVFRAGVKAIAQDVVEEMRHLVPHKYSNTGRTAKEIRSRTTQDSGRYVRVAISVGQTGQYLIEGTRPHMIFPRRARALRFAVGGQTVFARYVHHPGTAPVPIHEEAMQAVHAEQRLRQIAARVVVDMTRGS